MLQLARDMDRKSVERLAQQVHAMHVAWRPDLYTPTTILYPEERFQAAVAARELYVMKLSDTVIGFVLLRIRDVDRAGLTRRRVMVIDEICVEESMRNQGFGTQMMIGVKALAKAFGCTDLQLGVYPQNDSAVAFYQKCGLSIRSIDMQMKL